MSQAKKLAQNIKQYRLRRGLSQEELARQCQLKLSNLAKLESGYNDNPTLDTMLCISRAISDGSIDKLLK